MPLDPLGRAKITHLQKAKSTAAKPWNQPISTHFDVNIEGQQLKPDMPPF